MPSCRAARGCGLLHCVGTQVRVFRHRQGRRFRHRVLGCSVVDRPGHHHAAGVIHDSFHAQLWPVTSPRHRRFHIPGVGCCRPGSPHRHVQRRGVELRATDGHVGADGNSANVGSQPPIAIVRKRHIRVARNNVEPTRRLGFDLHRSAEIIRQPVHYDLVVLLGPTSGRIAVGIIRCYRKILRRHRTTHVGAITRVVGEDVAMIPVFIHTPGIRILAQRVWIEV